MSGTGLNISASQRTETVLVADAVVPAAANSVDPVIGLAPVKPDLLGTPTRELLEKFGAGRHQPGSGSAAALTGLLSCKLLRTVLSLCRERAPRSERLQKALPSLAKFDALIESTIEPYLMSAVQADAEAFHPVIVARKKRDRTTDQMAKAHYEEEQLTLLLGATEIPIEIAGSCVTLAERGLEVFDKGFLAARGDTGVAVSTATSAALGALSVVYLNLTSFKTIEWKNRARPLREKADQLLDRAQSLQPAMVRRVRKLQDEGDDTPQIKLI